MGFVSHIIFINTNNPLLVFMKGVFLHYSNFQVFLKCVGARVGTLGCLSAPTLFLAFSLNLCLNLYNYNKLYFND